MTSAFYGYAYAGEIRVGWGLAPDVFHVTVSAFVTASAFATASAFVTVSAWVNYFISGGAKKMAENANSPPLL